MTVKYVAAAALAATVIAGCGDRDEKTAPAAPSAATPAVDPEPPAAEVEYCGAEPCPCEPGSEQRHHGSEDLRQCKLTRAVDIQGYPAREGGEVTFYPDGALLRLYLADDFDVAGHPAKSQTGIELFEDGTVKTIFLREPKEIDGLTCADGVTFFDNGKLRRCKLAAEAELSGHEAQPGDFVTLDDTGTLHRWEIVGRTQPIGDHECSGYMNFLHLDGSLLRCGFTEDVEIEGTTYESDDVVCFGTDGKVTDCAQFTFDVGAG